MKGKIITICTISILFIIFTLGLTIFTNNSSMNFKKQKSNKNLSDQVLPDDILPDDLLINNNSNQDNQNTNENEMFLVKDYNGFIGVFKVDHANLQLCYIKDVKISDLPEKDQDMLKKGIFISGKNELNNLLEDYCS